MRRWVAALAGAFLLAGCATHLPAGVDGDLTDDWRLPPAARQFRPASNTCHDKLETNAPADTYSPVPCTESHLAETIAVDDLTGGAAMTSAAQAQGPAFRACARRADAFLGGDWRTGWLVLQPVLPGEAGWAGGARWFGCDLAETSPVDGSLIGRTSSLRGAMRRGSALRISCADATLAGEQVTAMHPVACSAGHTTEFAGLWESSVASPGSLTNTMMEKGCGGAIAKFAGIPDDDTLHNRVGWLGFPSDDNSWSLGDHTVRCFLWLNGDKMTGSYRNAGTSKLKIHYAR
jgi:hypothetical protein